MDFIYGGKVMRKCFILLLCLGWPIFDALAITYTCPNGYGVANVATNIVERTVGGACQPGYTIFSGNWDSDIVFATTGANCAIGTYPTANGCVAYPTDNCTDNYYTTNPTNIFARGDSDGNCASGYSEYYDTDLCRRYLGPDMADLCTPQKRCSAGANVLKSDETGMEIPIYDEQATQTTLNFIFDNGGHCYMNMLPGAENSVPTINVVDDNNNTFHGVR